MSRARPRVTHAPTSALFSRSQSRQGATLPSGSSTARASYVWSTPATTYPREARSSASEVSDSRLRPAPGESTTSDRLPGSAGARS
jgi:hypothetical protein